MKSECQYMLHQYALIQDSRSVLLEYCKKLTQRDFIQEHSSFGRGGSIRNLMMHVATTYQFWIGKHALQRDIQFPSYESTNKANGLTAIFHPIDQLMEVFINQCQEKSNYQIKLDDKVTEFTSIKLFTHVITHEFHHKGQILSISRQLGYTPIDTDIIR